MKRTERPFLLLVRKNKPLSTLLIDRQKYNAKKDAYDNLYQEADDEKLMRYASDFPQTFAKLGYEVGVIIPQSKSEKDGKRNETADEKGKSEQRNSEPTSQAVKGDSKGKEDAKLISKKAK